MPHAYIREAVIVGIEIQSTAPAPGRKRSVTLSPASVLSANVLPCIELYRDVAIWVQMWEVTLQKPHSVVTHLGSKCRYAKLIQAMIFSLLPADRHQ